MSTPGPFCEACGDRDDAMARVLTNMNAQQGRIGAPLVYPKNPAGENVHRSPLLCPTCLETLLALIRATRRSGGHKLPNAPDASVSDMPGGSSSNTEVLS